MAGAVLLLISLCLPENLYAYLTGDAWDYEQQIAVTNPNAASLSNYQILVAFDSASLITAGQMAADGRDLRFTSAQNDDATLLDYWIESGTINTDATYVWVKVPSLAASSSANIYMYYGNGAAPAVSSLVSTFRSSDLFLLTTRATDQTLAGYTDNHDEFDEIITRIGTPDFAVDGSGYVNAVNHNANPYGSSEYYFSRYRFLFVPSLTGTYYFGTNSDDASEILINSADQDLTHNVIASWYGGHGISGSFNHNSPVSLNAGYGYWIEYRMTEWRGGQLSRMGILPPAGSWQIVNSTNFSGQLFAREYADQEPTVSFPPSKLVFTTSEQTINTDGVSGVITIETQDQFSHVAVASADTAITLSSNSSTGQFSLTADPFTPISSAIISSGESSVNLYYRDSSSGTFTISVSSAGLTPASQTMNVQNLSAQWDHRIPVIINNADCTDALNDYQVLVTLNTAAIIAQGNMQADGADIRFTDSDDATYLSYWIESDTINSSDTYIWVKVPSVPASASKTIYLYYGNASATEVSSISQTFSADQIYLLTTRATDSGLVGYSDDHSEFDQIVDRIGQAGFTIDGTGYVERIDHNANPFGSDEYYFSRYRFLFTPAVTGEYYFGTDSDDASEILVNRADEDQAHNVIASWYGGHGTAGNFNHNGAVNLEADKGYWVEYRMTEWRGGQLSRMGVLEPGSSFKTLTADNFPGQIFTRKYSTCLPSSTEQFPITRIAFISPSQSIYEDRVSNQITIETQDVNGDPVAVTEDTTINLQTTSSKGEFSLNESPFLAVHSVTISADSSSASFYYRDREAGSYTLSALESPGRGWDDGQQTIEVLVFDYIGSYQYPVTITNPNAEDLSDCQVKVTVDTASLIAEGKMLADGSDIRFTDEDDATLLSYWIESDTMNTAQTYLWVRVPFLASLSNKTIYMYYGNPGAAAVSSIASTFQEDQIYLTTTRATNAALAGYTDNHNEFDQIIAGIGAAGFEIDGSGLVDALDHNANPFGSDEYYFSRYRFLFTPAVTGEYYFGTDSDDASEILVNRADEDQAHNVIASWYGGHGTAGNFNHNGAVNLEADKGYWVEYRMTEWRGGQLSRMGVLPPAGSWQTLNSSHFAGEFYCRNCTDSNLTVTEGEEIGNIAKLEFTTLPQTVVQGFSTELMSVQTQDASSVARPVTADTQIFLESSSLLGQFAPEDDPANWSADNTLTVTIPSGQDTARFYYRDFEVGLPTISASEFPTQGWQEATQQQTINSAVNTFQVTAGAAQVTGEAFALSITAIDQNGNVAVDYNDPVDLSVNYVSPLTGTGALSVAGATAFVNGIAVLNNVTYSNCGVITMTVTKSDDPAKTGSSSNISFAPDSFSLELSGLDFLAAHTVNKSFTLSATALDAAGAVCTGYQGPASLSVNTIDPPADQGASLSPEQLGNTLWNEGTAEIAEATFDRYGEVSLVISDDNLSTQQGTSQEIVFLPKDFLVNLSDPLPDRDFYYTHEPIDISVGARDENNEPVVNYQGTVGFEGTSLSLPETYTFIDDEDGRHEFLDISSSLSFEEKTLNVFDTQFSFVQGESEPITVKEARIQVLPNRGPVGNLPLTIQIIDEDDQVIVEDNSTFFTVDLEEFIDDGSATSHALGNPVVVTEGTAMIILNDDQAEQVTVTPDSTPGLKPVAGIATFGTVSGTGLGIQIYRELKDEVEQ